MKTTLKFGTYEIPVWIDPALPNDHALLVHFRLTFEGEIVAEGALFPSQNIRDFVATLSPREYQRLWANEYVEPAPPLSDFLIPPTSLSAREYNREIRRLYRSQYGRPR